ncbi:MAG: branched-chain amino acid ABC transporter permease [Anaerolineales bacterium]|nr:branched-chain amino acid ABC transporter permease [Anaerolineales bacterium]
MWPRRNLGKFLALIGLGIAFVVLPFVIGEYRLNAMLLILIYIIVASSFRLIVTTGEYNFAHVVIMGIGGYTSAMLARNVGLPFWATLPLGGLVAMSFAAVTAYPLFRMKGFYFFIGSFAIGEAVRLSWIRWNKLFGGWDGIMNLPRPVIGSFVFSSTFSYYLLTLGVAVACLLAMYQIERSRTGDTFKAIHSHDALAESVGVNLLKYKATAFMIAAFFAGMAGVLLAHYLGIVSPGQFGLTNMLYVLVWVTIGGVNTFWGPIVGVITLRLIHEQLTGVLADWTPLFYGGILIAVVFFLPDGLESIPAKIREWRTSRKR